MAVIGPPRANMGEFMALETTPGRIVYFGDSLSDHGALHEVTSRVLTVPVPPASAGYAGWFSNGEVQSGVTPGLLGASADWYAVGGARALGVRTIQDLIDENLEGETPPFDPVLDTATPEDLAFDINLGGQVARFLADAAAGGPVPGTAAAFFVGFNDYAGFQPASQAEAIAFVAAVVGQTVAAAATVGAAGAGTILLYELPGLSFFPTAAFLTPEQIALADMAIAAHNAGLQQGAALLRQGGLTVELVDMHRIAGELVADPSAFGLLPGLIRQPKLLGSASDPTLVLDENGQPAAFIPENPAVAGVDLDQLMFFDRVHPTAATHGVLGAFAAESLTSTTHLLGDDDDVVVGGRADDLVLAGGGADKVFAGRGADVVLAGLGRDRVSAGDGDDIVTGGRGNDVLDGGVGDDVLAGSDGNDVAEGGRGDDLIVDGLGRDVLLGGRGDDAFLYVEAALQGGRNATDGGSFFGGRGADTLYLALSAETEKEVLAELEDGEAHTFASIGLVAFGIETFVFVLPTEPTVWIESPARVAEADLWGIV
jgi:phospholipase/lecithinase/hemolysin